MKDQYLLTIRLIERLHRRFLDVIKAELDRLGIEDINNVQTLILSNIGEEQLTVGELTARGYYLGSNVSYNVKKLVELGYLHHQRSTVDRRTVRISLTEKGKAVRDMISQLYERHMKSIDTVGGLGHPEFAGLNKSLGKLERFWTDQILYKL